MVKLKSLILIVAWWWHGYIVTIDMTGKILIAVVSVGVYGVYEDISQFFQQKIVEQQDSCRDCGETGQFSNRLTKLSCNHAICLLCKKQRLQYRWKDSLSKRICCDRLIKPACSCHKTLKDRSNDM